MTQKYTTIADKLTEIGIDLDSADTYQLSEDLRSSGATVIGYTTNEDVISLLYEDSEALASALECCRVSLPKKKIEAPVEGKKGRGRKIEKGEEAIAEN